MPMSRRPLSADRANSQTRYWDYNGPGHGCSTIAEEWLRVLCGFGSTVSTNALYMLLQATHDYEMSQALLMNEGGVISRGLNALDEPLVRKTYAHPADSSPLGDSTPSTLWRHRVGRKCPH